MNDNELILAELRKITDFVDFHRKLTKWSLIGGVICMGVALVGGLVVSQIVNQNIKAAVTPAETTWYEVDRNILRGDFDKAIGIGEELIKKAPLKPSGHIRMGNAYLDAGRLQEAHKQYAEAYRLFPSEEYLQNLKALEKRLSETSQPKSSPEVSPP